jgi:hypothetical protein
MRQYLALGGLALAGLAMLGGVAAWLDHNGYARAKIECAIAAGRQSAEIAGLRRQIEEGWRDAGDRIAEQRKDLDDAVATVDATPAGTTLCLPADSVRALDAIR